VADSTVLVVDDEPRIVDFLSENLRADDYRVLCAQTGEEALDILRTSRPDVVLLDVLLPGMSGLEVCRTVRTGDGISASWDPQVPIIMLSAKAEGNDRVRGLERGADDYVSKPFHYPELLARMAALIARSRRSEQGHITRVGDLVINTLSRQVRVAGHPVRLSVKEYELLVTLASDPERVFSKDHLLQAVWGFLSPGRTRTLDSHASRLRQKLAEQSDEPWIVNVWGVGYRLHCPE
jgi:DNA-binding response OmpR family regulator